jgi:hypothetical protein
MTLKAERIPAAPGKKTIRTAIDAAPVPPGELLDEIRQLRERVADVLHRAQVLVRAA